MHVLHCPRSVGDIRDAQGQIVGEGRGAVSVIGAAGGVVAVHGFDFAAALGAHVDRQGDFGGRVLVLRFRIDLHHADADNFTDRAHHGGHSGGAGLQFVDVEVHDDLGGHGDKGQVTEHRSPVKGRIDLHQ